MGFENTILSGGTPKDSIFCISSLDAQSNPNPNAANVSTTMLLLLHLVATNNFY